MTEHGRLKATVEFEIDGQILKTSWYVDEFTMRHHFGWAHSCRAATSALRQQIRNRYGRSGPVRTQSA
jgi:hypothetical protein